MNIKKKKRVNYFSLPLFNLFKKEANYLVFFKKNSFFKIKNIKKMENGSSSSGSYSPSSSISFLDSSPNNSESEGEGEGNTYFLPSEIWQNIFNYLSFPDLFKVAQTCQMFRSIIHQKRSMFWRGKFWPINSGSLCPSNRLCHAGTIIDNSSGVFLIILCGDKPRPQSSTRNVGEILNDIWAFNLRILK